MVVAPTPMPLWGRIALSDRKRQWSRCFLASSFRLSSGRSDRRRPDPWSWAVALARTASNTVCSHCMTHGWLVQVENFVIITAIFVIPVEPLQGPVPLRGKGVDEQQDDSEASRVSGKRA